MSSRTCFGTHFSAPTARWVLTFVRMTVITAAGIFACFIWQRSTLASPRASSIVSDRHGVFMAQVEGTGGTGYGYWPVDSVPPRVAAAMLALEDHRFNEHWGVDPLAVARAVRSNLASGHRVSGASTIAMQVVRLQAPEHRTYLAKAVEAASAIVMTARYGRDAVLRQYLKLVPLGQSSHGIAHAARWYFDKPVEDLSWAEIAFLSAIPQAPAAMNPARAEGCARAIERGRQALERLHAQGIIGDADYAQSLDDIAALAPHGVERRPADSLHAILEVSRLLQAGEALEQVRSTIDLGIQHDVTKLARDRLNSWTASGARQVAAIVVDRSTMEVLAWVGSAKYDATDSGEIDFATRSRSPGSTLKPFIYAEALDQGTIAPSTILADDPDNGTGIDNADHRYLGPLLPRQALGNSRNVPAAKLVGRIGVERTHWFLARLGLHDEKRPAERYGLTLAIGGLPTGLDRLVTAYGALANDGMLKPLVWYGDESLPDQHRVLSRLSAGEVTNFLADPMARLPSFTRMGSTEYPFPVSIKTGTSQGYRDAWTVAYSARYIVGIWAGRPDGRPMTGMSGSQVATLAHDIMLYLHGPDSDGLADIDPPAPAGLKPVTVCASTGQAVSGNAACDRQLTEYLPTTPALIAATAPVSSELRIASPRNNSRILINPETPDALNFLALRLGKDATGPVVWYVDGHEFQPADASDTVQWKLAPGEHSFQARRPDGAGSRTVEITVE
jgi:penicillin-binding protein 1C